MPKKGGRKYRGNLSSVDNLSSKMKLDTPLNELSKVSNKTRMGNSPSNLLTKANNKLGMPLTPSGSSVNQLS